MKLALRLLAVLALLLGGLLLFALLFLDGLVKTAVERGGSEALGVETRLGKADIGLFSGRFGLEQFEIGNPEGFQRPQFLSMSEARMELAVPSLLKDTVVVPQLYLSGIRLDIEQNERGTNYGVLMKNLERFQGPPAESPDGKPQPRAEGSGKKYLLREVIVRDVRVTADIDTKVAGRREIAYTLPELAITDLGTGDEARPMAEQIGLIVKALLAAAVQSGRELLPQDLLADLDRQLARLGEKLPDVLPEGLRSEVEGALEGAGQKLQKTTDDLQKKADDAARKAAEGLQGLDPGSLLKKKPGGT